MHCQHKSLFKILCPKEATVLTCAESLFDAWNVGHPYLVTTVFIIDLLVFVLNVKFSFLFFFLFFLSFS